MITKTDNIKILVVDDKEENRYLLDILLKGAGYTPVLAVNGVEAMECLQEGGVDLIVSDILMPVMDGFELCRKVKSDQKLRQIPFIIYTATYTGPKDEEFALKIGADRFILKPCEPEVFLKAVQEVLDTSTPKEPAGMPDESQEQEILKLYNERLIKKLEQKMLQLEEEVKSRHAAEAAVRNQLEFLATLINTIPSPVYYKDASGKYLGCNRAYEEFCGLDGARIIGKTSHDINTFELAENVSKTDAELIESAGKLSEETFIRLPDGTVLAAILNRATFMDADGKACGLVGVIIDINERKKAEDDLRRSKEYIEKIVGSVNEGLCVFDTEGRHVMVNSALCAITGFDSEELIGVGPPYPYWPSDEQAAIKDAYRKTVNGELQDFRLELKRKNGQGFPVLASPGIIRDENGNILNYIVTVKDLTEFTLLESQLNQAQKMEAIGQLTGGIAHDFNNLLLPIIGYSDLILEDMEPDNQFYNEVLQIKQAGEKAKDLTVQLLAFGRKQIMEMKVVDLRDVVSDFQKIFRRTVREDISIRLQLSSHSNPILADISKIGQILMNLTVNAQDAMPEGGSISIETSEVDLDESYANFHQGAQPGTYVMLSFTDTGCGMDKRTLKHLFEPFFTTKEPGKGTGLGLSTVFGIVKQHNGYIMVYSEPGMGTSFKIFIPKALGEPAFVGESDERQDIRNGTESLLVVEDDQTVRTLICKILRKHGYTVFDFDNVQECLKELADNPRQVHLLLTDVIMPGFNGRQLYEQLCADMPELKVIFMSGYPYDLIVEHGVLMEGVSFISKPFTAKNIIKKINSVLDATSK